MTPLKVRFEQAFNLINLINRSTTEIQDANGVAYAVEMDVTSENQVKEAFSNISSNFKSERVDVLVANAGFQHISSIEDFGLSEWQKMVSFL